MSDHDRPYGAAARLVTYLRDHALTYEAFGKLLKPPVTKAAVSAWTRQVAIPSEAYRRQIDERSRGFVPEGGWAPTSREFKEASALLARAAVVKAEIVAVAAVRTVQRADRVREEVRPIPKGQRQRWTRWHQQPLPL